MVKETPRSLSHGSAFNKNKNNLAGGVRIPLRLSSLHGPRDVVHRPLVPAQVLRGHGHGHGVVVGVGNPDEGFPE